MACLCVAVGAVLEHSVSPQLFVSFSFRKLSKHNSVEAVEAVDRILQLKVACAADFRGWTIT